jgi:hypothetical protein
MHAVSRGRKTDFSHLRDTPGPQRSTISIAAATPLQPRVSWSDLTHLRIADQNPPPSALGAAIAAGGCRSGARGCVMPAIPRRSWVIACAPAADPPPVPAPRAQPTPATGGPAQQSLGMTLALPHEGGGETPWAKACWSRLRDHADWVDRPRARAPATAAHMAPLTTTVFKEGDGGVG